MAASDQVEVTCPISTWTELTAGDVTAITFQVMRGRVYIRYSTGATPTEEGGFLYKAGEGEITASIADLTYLTSADRVFAKPSGNRAAIVLVDHA